MHDICHLCMHILLLADCLKGLSACFSSFGLLGFALCVLQLIYEA